MTSTFSELGKEVLAGYPLLYETEIYPKVKHLRGATRLQKWNRKIGEFIVSSKTSEGNYRLDVLESKPVFQSREDFKYYFFENKYFSKLYNELLETDVFCDVGGYHGFYGLVSNSEQSIIFEADPNNAEYIRENIALSPDQDIELVEKAVWSSNGSLEFEAEGSGTSHVSNEGIERESVTLDTFFEDRQDPDVLKIDVEGAEGHVLEGAERLLCRSHPVLFIELHLNNRIQSFGHSIDEIQSFLSELGYDLVWHQDRGGEVHCVFKIEGKSPQSYWDSFQSEALPPETPR